MLISLLLTLALAGNCDLTAPADAEFAVASPGAAEHVTVLVELWSEPEFPDTLSLDHIAVGRSREGFPVAYVTGSINADPGQLNQDVFVAQLDPGGGIIWETRVAGPGAELPGGLGVGPLGFVRLAFSSDNPKSPTISTLSLSSLLPMPAIPM